jgi:Tol biopolymer transport system component
MSKVDDELTRRFHRVGRPVDVEGLFEGLERRRSHRERARKIQATALAFVVLAGSMAGFLALRAAFVGDGRFTGDPGPLPSNGRIVFSREGDDGRFHLFSARPDGSGLRQITEDATNDTDPAVSPDGKSIAFVHELDQGIRVIATVPIDGGTVTWLTDEELDAHDPAWSSDGTRLAFVGASRFEGSPVPDSVVYVSRPGSPPSALLHNVAIAFADPSWSSDDDTLAVAARDLVDREGVTEHWTIAEISSDDPPQPQLGSTDVDELAPAWSPDGTRIAFLRVGGDGDEVWTRSRNDGSETLIATAVETTLEPDLSWAPDGSSVLVSDGDWIFRVEATPAGDPRDNFVRLVRGSSPSWQPVPADAGPSLVPSPSVSRSTQPEGRDIGLGFRVCQVTALQAQFDGEGPTDTAFVATRLEDDLRCPSNVEQAEAYVGIDLDQDGLVDGSFGPIICDVYYCRVFAAPDLDGNDGKRELLVVEGAGSIVGLGVYALGGGGGPSGNVDVARIHIGEPDLVQNGFVTGEPARLFIGGDEGWSYRLRCEDHGGNRFLYQQRAFRPVDSPGPATVDETTLVYSGQRLDVFDAREPEQSTSDNPLGPQPSEVCEAPLPAA